MLSVPLQAILLSILIHTLWGGNPIGAKFGLEVFPPAWSAFVRFLFGISTIALWSWYRGHRIWPSHHEWRPMLLIGLLFSFQIWLMNLGFDNTSGVNGSILISTNPLFAAMFAHLMISNDRLTKTRTTGLLIAFAGVCLTLWKNDEGGLSVGTIGDWLCLASAAFLGFRLVASAKVMRRVDPFRLAIWQMLFSLPLFAIVGATTETIRWSAFSWSAIWGLAYQGIVVAGFGFMASLWLISRYQPSIMAGFNFISPVTGVLLSASLLGETINQSVIAGTALVALGMILITVNFEGRKRAPA